MHRGKTAPLQKNIGRFGVFARPMSLVLYWQRMMAALRGTTILLVRRGKQVALAGDGQVTLGDTVIKSTAKKIRRLHNNQVLAGFAGSTADAFSLFARFESKLEQFQGNLPRAAVELAKEWRTDKVLRHLAAQLVVSDKKNSFLVSGDGDIIEPDNGVIAIGSGGPYALAAAQALLGFTKISAQKIALESLNIAGNICIYTNSAITVETL